MQCRLPLNAAELVIDEWLPGVDADQDAVELHLGQLPDERPVLGQAPRFRTDRKVVDGSPHPGSQLGFFNDVEFRELEWPGRRKKVLAEGVADAETVSEFADGPEGGGGAATTDDQGSCTAGGFETPDHQALVCDLWPGLADGIGDSWVGGGAADEDGDAGVGSFVPDDPGCDTEDLFPLRGEFAGCVEFQRRGFAANDNRHGWGGGEAGGQKQQRDCEGVTDHGVDSCRGPDVGRGTREKGPGGRDYFRFFCSADLLAKQYRVLMVRT